MYMCVGENIGYMSAGACGDQKRAASPGAGAGATGGCGPLDIDAGN